MKSMLLVRLTPSSTAHWESNDLSGEVMLLDLDTVIYGGYGSLDVGRVPTREVNRKSTIIGNAQSSTEEDGVDPLCIGRDVLKLL